MEHLNELDTIELTENENQVVEFFKDKIDFEKLIGTYDLIDNLSLMGRLAIGSYLFKVMVMAITTNKFITDLDEKSVSNLLYCYGIENGSHNDLIEILVKYVSSKTLDKIKNL